MKIISKKILHRRPIGDISFIDSFNIPPLLKRLYVQRGVKNSYELELNFSRLSDYNQLIDINKAIDLLIFSLKNNFKIFVVGDYDTDGATSTALIILALRKMGASSIKFIVPNRFKDGYGLSPKIVNQAEKNGAEIIITVDNGMSSHTAVDIAHQKGILVIIVDHHLPENTIPSADAIVNPHLSINNLSLNSLSGVGVIFYLMLGLRYKLNKIGWFINNGLIPPKLADFLDLVALGTIADLVPLDFNNRILVYQGIKRIRAGQCRPGIRALIEISKKNISHICSIDLGFFISPLINSIGRLDDMSIGIILLLTEDIHQARFLAKKVNTFNKKRKNIEKKMENQALNICDKMIFKNQELPFGMVIYHEKWHQGILGIIASKLKERFNRPVIAFTLATEGILKGSGRSVKGLHIRNLLNYLDKLYPGMIIKFGGHAMSIGLIIHKEQFNKFYIRFTKLINEWMKPSMLEDTIWSDGELSEQEISITTAELLRDSGPWGESFPVPIFDGKFRIINQFLINEKHLKLILEPFNGNNRLRLKAIAFNVDRTLWPDHKRYILKIAYQLDINEFNNTRYVQLLIQYIWPL